jgi:acetyl esterase/lipase
MKLTLAPLLIAAGLVLGLHSAFAADVLTLSQPEIRLWSGDAPGSEGKTAPETWNPSTDGFHRVTNINQPSFFVFLPPKEKANGTAIVISPGGGHHYHVMDLEGSLVAERLNAMGIAAFVLKSRLARAPGSTYSLEEHSLRDAQRALRLVRHRAAEWGVNPARVGIMGFSAGGELAALAATKFESAVSVPNDPVDAQNARPDFAVLAYGGVRGENFMVLKNTPPMFLVAANDDNPAANLAAIYVKLRAERIPAEIHIYLKGGHGFGMTGRTPAFRDLSIARWPEQLQAWLVATELLTQ